MLKNKKKLIVIGSIFASGTIFAALYGGGPAEAWTEAQIAAHVAAVNAHIAAFGTSYSAQMQAQYEQTISAIAVATKQEALAANIVSDSTRNAAQQLVNAVSSQQTADLITKNLLDYSPLTGQGFNTCGVYAKNKSLDKAYDSIHEQAANFVVGLDNAPGTSQNSVVEALNNRMSNHLKNFCTEAEAKAGLCKESKLPGGDTNAALLFTAAEPGSLNDLAQKAYIENVLGTPDPSVSKLAGQSVEGQNYLYQKNRKDGLLSIPAYSLARIKYANTKQKELNGYSPNEALQNRVNAYFGGSEAEQWAKSLAVQTPRGLMVESLKVGGLQTWISHKEFEQTQRINANRAALILASSDQNKNELAVTHNRALSDQLKREVE